MKKHCKIIETMDAPISKLADIDISALSICLYFFGFSPQKVVLSQKKEVFTLNPSLIF